MILPVVGLGDPASTVGLGELGRQTEHVLEEGFDGRGRWVDGGRRWRRDGEDRSRSSRSRRRRRSCSTGCSRGSLDERRKRRR